jgi:hypothetical protein
VGLAKRAANRRAQGEIAVSSYESDVVAWADEQARLLRAGCFDRLDIEHIAEEIEDVGKSEQRELATRMALLLAHLLKCQYQPERRGASWEGTIREQRRALGRRLNRTPSLQNCIADADWWADAWLDARMDAENETGIGFDAFPASCPWVPALVLDESWLPD